MKASGFRVHCHRICRRRLPARASRRPVWMNIAWQQPGIESLDRRGAGGALPLNERELMIDLMAVLGLPIVVAARSTLGTINHTLLTLEALRSHALPIAGVVLVGPPNVDNKLVIEAHGHRRGHWRASRISTR